MWDGGSTLSFITFKKAGELGLKGRPVDLKITVVGGESKAIKSRLYRFKLHNPRGSAVWLEAYGISEISTRIEAVALDRLAKLLDVQDGGLSRPQSGEVDVLIGQQHAALHPVRVKCKGNLILMENDFGFVVAGTCALASTDAHMSTNFITVREGNAMHMVAEDSSMDFFDIESLGVRCEPRCGGCRCGTCHPGGKQMSLQEEKEYRMIEDGLRFRDECGRWEASYPWIRPASELPNNRCVAMAALRSAENRLRKKRELADTYNAQIEDMVDRGAARIVTEEELFKYQGPKFYIHHFEVLNPKSKSTPCRIVYNSSANYKGHSLNSHLAKGPSMLNRLLGVLLRFREGKHAFIGDISKMFHAITIPLKDQMTHLFLWRNLKEDCAPTTYAMTAVNMGDRPSSAIAQIALRKTAEEARNKKPLAAETIKRNSYMDDILGSTRSAEDTADLTKDMTQVLAERGFKIKEWICSYLSNVSVPLKNSPAESLVQEEVLGITWWPKKDLLSFAVDQKRQYEVLTKRKMLSFANTIYDPVGLLTPVTVKLKILIRAVWMCEPKIDWDDEVPANISQEWKQLTADLNGLSETYFQRSITPENAVGNPVLVVFSDGSENAYGAVAYARWKLENGTYSARLISAKSRLAPLNIVDIVRLELCGAVLSKRLRFTVASEMSLRWEKVFHFTDSEIVQAMTQKESYGFNTFAANRVGEIHQATNKNEWYWVSGKLNIADLTTRGAKVREIDGESIWQNGPAFLTLEEELWPVRKTARSDILLPELKQKLIVAATCSPTESLLERFNLDRFSRWRLLIHTTARIIRLYRRFKKNQTNLSLQPTIADIRDAEDWWIAEAQKKINVDACKQLKPSLENGIIVVGGRAERWMQATWNKQKFVLLPKDHPISNLIMVYEHKAGGHLGVASTISKIRSRYWILGITKAVKAMITACAICQRIRKRLCIQQMSALPVERLKPSPAFLYTCIDYFGPFMVKGEVQKRVRGKCYGVIFTCLACRAVYLDLAKDYSTDAFLQVLRRFASLRGWPAKIYSDPGTQLVGASNELKKAIEQIEWNAVTEHGTKNCVEWVFSPADAQWQNGAVEALVKTVKRALNAAIGENTLSFSELLTVLYEASQLVNERPIGTHTSDPDSGTYLAANDLLMGRASSKVPQGPFNQRSSDKHRLDFIQSVVNQFWKRWTNEVFPSLVMQKKWHTASRNLQCGDIVLIKDSNNLRGKWKMGKVTKSIASQDGKVRRVQVVCISETGQKHEIERAPQSLILLAPSSNVVPECSA